MSIPLDLAPEFCSICNRLDCDFDAISSLLDKDVSFRDKLTAVISTYVDQPRTASAPEPEPEQTQAVTAIPPSKCDSEAGSGSNGNVPSRLPAASAEANLQSFADSRGGRIPTIVAKMEKIGSPEILERLWASCRASRAQAQSIAGGTRQMLTVEAERDMTAYLF
ncbi:hypothetical protein AAL_08136 [Moelleriella libera RCEF 2490]|uniref:Uncharacterized protein n=1 Tax=Moelleriella libera RCEF 2490 TaxID=1081109 RepID=A0A167VXS4_9HYPO|nr:hypothetical protein AAL_08136 [Moelleriella libera RCEF 2490]